MTREFTALGSKVVESNMPFKGPEDQEDFWEGEKFEGEQQQACFMQQTLCRALI